MHTHTRTRTRTRTRESQAFLRKRARTRGGGLGDAAAAPPGPKDGRDYQQSSKRGADRTRERAMREWLLQGSTSLAHYLGIKCRESGIESREAKTGGCGFIFVLFRFLWAREKAWLESRNGERNVAQAQRGPPTYIIPCVAYCLLLLGRGPLAFRLLYPGQPRLALDLRMT
ncbi:hypothetical protein BGW36DRAFT_5269 [Talaromyces proteolyticus]|uniref:Uncharacterized protein n=1 Tax=Talaromyces proteolyticus TaxID=1131652 RepID=A0AAD4L6S2_9EURO|nr:uncharacterized protein BGW36DRAFT_5269 [Talaromyces proteolyticus]KAH8704989.1 hypothetical protein BGW36DRAFT_5269 [Talaromyces proteolyticus]